MSKDQILKALADAPRSIASELGTTTIVMRELEQAGKVVRVGNRKTNQRGRPPVEWAVAGVELPDVEVAKVEKIVLPDEPDRGWPKPIGRIEARDIQPGDFLNAVGFRQVIKVRATKKRVRLYFRGAMSHDFAPDELVAVKRFDEVQVRDTYEDVAA